jgi:hypothetical protein
MGSILQDKMGPDAATLITKRQIDAINGNIGSYSRLLNSSERLKLIADVNSLAVAVAEIISRDKDNAKKHKIEEAKEVALRKVAKKQAAECTEETHRLEARGHLIPLMEKFETGEKPCRVLKPSQQRPSKRISSSSITSS